MEPVLDAEGRPVNGVQYNRDGRGDSVKNRLWRGQFVSDFDGVEERLDRLCAEFQPRKDDLFILAYLKCGTHWLHEICHFLLTRQTQQRPTRKEDLMLECEDLESIEKFASPRVLNCHLRWSQLPPQIASDANKVVYVLRNPKDTAVSLYHHYCSISDYEYNGSFAGFLALYESGQLDSGSWFDHTRDFLRAIDARAATGGGNILMVEYEKLKRQPAQQIRRIADFLLDDSVLLDDELLQAICERVSFSSMRADRSVDHNEFFKEEAGKSGGFYRKGEVGDWRNWMSDDDSRRIDELTAAALRGFEHLYQPIYE